MNETEFTGDNMDLIVGIHSIVEAIKNPKRQNIRLVLTKDALSELKRKKLDLSQPYFKVEIVDSTKLHSEAQKSYKKIGREYQRVPSGMFLESGRLKILNVSHIYRDLECGKRLKIFSLDQVTDVHNGAAVLRTAAFYGVDYLVLPVKGIFGPTPSFFRIASGATEHVKIVTCPNLSKVLKKMIQLGVECVGFSEHAEDENVVVDPQKSLCLVMGAEDKGLSHAVNRILEKIMMLPSKGSIKSLNVSVASAIAMEKFLSAN